jgi:DNA-binding XRE family transcriptional regulator
MALLSGGSVRILGASTASVPFCGPVPGSSRLRRDNFIYTLYYPTNSPLVNLFWRFYGKITVSKRQVRRMFTMLAVAPLKEKLREERRRAGFTQGELADKASVGINTIVRIETGDITEPRVSTLRKLATALGLEVRDLLTD